MKFTSLKTRSNTSSVNTTSGAQLSSHVSVSFLSVVRCFSSFLLNSVKRVFAVQHLLSRAVPNAKVVSSAGCNAVSRGLRTTLSIVVAVVSLQCAALAAAEVIDINVASAEVLADGITGIGPVKAQAIVDYRNTHGDFNTLSDLLSVPGIGQSLYEKIRLGLSVSSVQGDSTEQVSSQVTSGVASGASSALTPTVQQPIN